MGKVRRKNRVEPTDAWEQFVFLCRWSEQASYGEIRPLSVRGRGRKEG